MYIRTTTLWSLNGWMYKHIYAIYISIQFALNQVHDLLCDAGGSYHVTLLVTINCLGLGYQDTKSST